MDESLFQAEQNQIHWLHYTADPYQATMYADSHVTDTLPNWSRLWFYLHHLFGWQYIECATQTSLSVTDRKDNHMVNHQKPSRQMRRHCIGGHRLWEGMIKSNNLRQLNKNRKVPPLSSEWENWQTPAALPVASMPSYCKSGLIRQSCTRVARLLSI